MSYKIGQFRKDGTNSYLNLLGSLSQRKISTTYTNVVGGLKFQDVALSIDNGFRYVNCYYLRFQIPRQNTIQSFTVSLGNIDGENQISNEQYLKTFSVPALDLNDENNNVSKSVVFEMVFNPTLNFTDIIVKLNRTIEDYQQTSTREDGTIGRTFSIENLSCYEIQNIITNLTGVSEIIKLGVQSRPGLLMCINGQEIRVGPSGIYEIKSGYKVTFIGFVIIDTSTADDYFILDYQYEGR